MNQEADQTDIRVLLVEDEPLVRWIERRSLESSSCIVVEAESGEEAEKLWCSNTFDVVILDHRLNDGLGVDLLRKMRIKSNTTKVVYLTAEAELITEDIVEELQVDVVLSKPLEMNRLSEVVSALTRASNRIPNAENHEQSEKKKVLMSQTTEELIHVIGAYTVLLLPEILTTAYLRQITNDWDKAQWIALEMTTVKKIDEHVEKELLVLGEQLWRAGSRFCLVGVSSTLADQFQSLLSSMSIDRVENLEALASLSRRLSSICERQALLGSVVTRRPLS